METHESTAAPATIEDLAKKLDCTLAALDVLSAKVEELAAHRKPAPNSRTMKCIVLACRALLKVCSAAGGLDRFSEENGLRVSTVRKWARGRGLTHPKTRVWLWMAVLDAVYDHNSDFRELINWEDFEEVECKEVKIAVSQALAYRT